MEVYRSSLCDTSEVVAKAYYDALSVFFGGCSGGRGLCCVGGDRCRLVGGSGVDGMSSGDGLYCVPLLGGYGRRYLDSGCGSVESVARGSVVGESQGGVVGRDDGRDESSGVSGRLVVECRETGDAGVVVGFGEKVSSEEKADVSGSVKKKMGKNQRDRAKYEKMGTGKREKSALPLRGVTDGNWRKGATSGNSGSVSVISEPSVSLAVEDKSDARKTLERKWVVENEVAIAKAELAKVKAKKDIEFQCARDVEAEIRRSRTLVMKQTESNKVATEKAFATLRATGNVPGFCETVVSGGESVPGLSGGSSAEGCRISPDSSASMHEFREAQKKILDLEDKIRKMERAERMRATVGEVAITNDGDEPTPSLQEEMDRLDEKYNTQYVYEPAAIGGKNVLLLRCETFGDYCEGGDY